MNDTCIIHNVDFKKSRGSREPIMDIIEQKSLFDLILAVQQGDEIAFSKLYDVLIPRVYSLAQRIVRNNADTEEVVCDSFTQIWQQAKNYHPDKGSVIAWCMVITRSRSLDYLRKRKVRSGKIDDVADYVKDVADEGNEPDKLLESFQENSKTRHLLESLTEIQRQLIALSFFKGFSHQEISDSTTIPLGTVKSHIRRALEQLQKISVH